MKKRAMKRAAIAMTVFLLLTPLAGCSQDETDQTEQQSENTVQAADVSLSIGSGNLRKIVYALVSSAENSTTDWQDEYGYIEDIGDGRGYTAGLIGFTTGTGDLEQVVQEYTDLDPDNALKDYLPVLKKLVGSDSTEGLGNDFVKAWKSCANDADFQKAQNIVINETCMSPALDFAQKDGLSPLGQYIYYDSIVVHGLEDDEYAHGFNYIRTEAMKEAKTPKEGGDEAAYLEAFLSIRTKVMEEEEAHQDLSRIDVQKKFIEQKNFNLSLPLSWTMYGDNFELTKKEVNAMPDAGSMDE